MRPFTRIKDYFVILFGGLPPEEERPSRLFTDLGYAEGEVVFSSARLALSFDDIDRRLWDTRNHATRIGLADGSRIVVPHMLGDITIEDMFVRADGREYVAICSRNDLERNFSIKQLRRYHRMFARQSGEWRPWRRAFPGIPTSDN